MKEGVLGRDYHIVYENGRIYIFPDRPSEPIDDPMDRPVETHSLDAFVRDTNRISRLRTDSPEFPLRDGYNLYRLMEKVVVIGG